MYKVQVETTFRGDHQLVFEDGTKEPLHSHDWIVKIEICSDELNSIGLVIDFVLLKDLLARITCKMESDGLSEIVFFKEKNPSAENVARYIYEELQNLLPQEVNLGSVKVTEEPGCSAIYYK